jgi:hypothetical protein
VAETIETKRRCPCAREALLAGVEAKRTQQKARLGEMRVLHSPPRLRHAVERTSMSNHESDQSSQESPRSPVTAGAILLGIFIALSLAVGGLVHLAELIRAADVMDGASRTGSFDTPPTATSVQPSEPT